MSRRFAFPIMVGLLAVANAAAAQPADPAPEELPTPTEPAPELPPPDQLPPPPPAPPGASQPSDTVVPGADSGSNSQPSYGTPDQHGYAPPPPPPPRIRRTGYRHDGFYLRFGIGPAYGKAHSDSGDSQIDLKATFDGWGPAYELLIGGTPVAGFVIGGGLVGQDIRDPSIQIDVSGGASTSAVAKNEALGVVLLGPFIDWFPDPTSGGHVGAMFGIGAIGLQGDDGNASSGYGGSVWGGYDFWVGKQSSIGPEARVVAISAERDVLGVPFNDSATSFELLFTALLH